MRSARGRTCHGAPSGLRHDVGVVTVTCENTQGESMTTANHTPAATEQDRPSVRTSSRSGLADSALGTRNLMMVAAPAP